MKKEELARAIFEERNRLKELKGEQPLDLNSPLAQRKMWELSKNPKAELEQELRKTQEYYKVEKIQKEHDAKVAEYYATPEGAAIKAETEQAIERKEREWREFETATGERLGKMVHSILGKAWGINRYKKGYVEIGVIDTSKSTPESREFYFGQYIEVRYEERHWLEKREVFEAGCGSTGSFSMAGGTTVGERAMFYAGIGRLFADTQTVAELKATLKKASQKSDLLSKEYNDLRHTLANPLPEEE